MPVLRLSRHSYVAMTLNFFHRRPTDSIKRCDAVAVGSAFSHAGSLCIVAGEASENRKPSKMCAMTTAFGWDGRDFRTRRAGRISVEKTPSHHVTLLAALPLSKDQMPTRLHTVKGGLGFAQLRSGLIAVRKKRSSHRHRSSLHKCRKSCRVELRAVSC